MGEPKIPCLPAGELLLVLVERGVDTAEAVQLIRETIRMSGGIVTPIVD
jgi:hypothetical protein